MTRILLVHGALAGASSWAKVIPYLQRAGHSVTAVQQPLTSIDNDVRIVKSTLERLNEASAEPIVVVGHSFGGLVITNAATDTPNVKALVYVQAFAPDQGESVASLGSGYPDLESAKHFVPEGSGRLLLPQDDFVKYFAPDVDPQEAQVLAATQGPCDGDRFGYVSGSPAWKQVKRVHYVVGQKDQIIQPELQRFFAKRIGGETYELKGASHAGLISQAEKVADIILKAANE